MQGGPASEDSELPPGQSVAVRTEIDYPHVYGAGVAYRSTDGRWTASFEWDRVEYSRIFSSLGATTSGEFIPDGSEFHLGGEYVFLTTGPLVALRAGLWQDPNHQVQSSFDDPILEGLLGIGGDEMHYSMGLGAAFERFQVDLGADFSDRQDQLSISGIYSW